MRAFEIRYDYGGSSGNRTVVLVEHEDNIPYELAKKDRNFNPDSRWDKITHSKEVLVTSVKLTDLNVGDLLRVLEK